jgi:hypothetical protein
MSPLSSDEMQVRNLEIPSILKLIQFIFITANRKRSPVFRFRECKLIDAVDMMSMASLSPDLDQAKESHIQVQAAEYGGKPFTINQFEESHTLFPDRSVTGSNR